MNNTENKIIFQSSSIFWDGIKQLSGTLELRETKLGFKFDDFKHSHLELHIELKDIENAKVFLVFNITNNGLKITSKGDKVDMFILDDNKAFCQALLEQIKRTL